VLNFRCLYFNKTKLCESFGGSNDLKRVYIGFWLVVYNSALVCHLVLLRRRESNAVLKKTISFITIASQADMTIVLAYTSFLQKQES